MASLDVPWRFLPDCFFSVTVKWKPGTKDIVRNHHEVVKVFGEGKLLA